MKEIKAKQVIKDIKTLDKTADVSRRMKNAYIRTKNQTELPEHNNNSSYVNDAENSIRDGTGTIVKNAGHIVENYGKKQISGLAHLIAIKVLLEIILFRILGTYSLDN